MESSASMPCHSPSSSQCSQQSQRWPASYQRGEPRASTPQLPSGTNERASASGAARRSLTHRRVPMRNNDHAFVTNT